MQAINNITNLNLKHYEIFKLSGIYCHCNSFCQLRKRKPHSAIAGNSPPPQTKPLEVKQGILVFDSQESFDKTFDEVKNMNKEERKAWEENLGFKSFERLKHEIIDNEIAYTDQFENQPKAELKKMVESGDYKPYSQMAQKYIEKGIVIREIKNGEEYMEFIKPIFPELINEDGFVVVGDEIRQFTEKEYKVIKSRDFSKLEKIMSINTRTDNQEFFVSKINALDSKKSIGVHINAEGSSLHHSTQHVTLKEYARSYNTGGNIYISVYDIEIDNWKKGLFNWKRQYAMTWYQGHFYVTEGRHSLTPPYDIVYTTTPYNYSGSGEIDQWHKTVYSHSWGIGGNGSVPEWIIPTYPALSNPVRTLWQAVRTGGPAGMGVNIWDHSEVVSY